MKRQRTAVFISGRGSNLEALLFAARQVDYPASIELVLSDRPHAPGLQRAWGANIPAYVVNKKDQSNHACFEEMLEHYLNVYSIDLICLAGFMSILSSDFTKRWFGRALNIHPSLLPEFPGLNTHVRALQSGVSYHGCSVHFVTHKVDAGPIILQRKIPILPGDTSESLGVRVLAEEHKAYPEALASLASAWQKINTYAHSMPKK
jgi:formyltetrahydrofolate-dependent phosphoribosylglycinamide formyltransferase